MSEKSQKLEEWDDKYCKICFNPCETSPFNCKHLVHFECQVQSGDPLCVECRTPFRVTRKAFKQLGCWRRWYQLKEHYPHSSDDE